MAHTASTTGSLTLVPSRGVGEKTSRYAVYRFITFVTTFAMLFGGLLLAPRMASAASAVTTAALNLRTGPGLDFEVIRVMPEGASISVDGDPETGYYPVSYDGSTGYAAVDFIQIGGTGDTNTDGEDVPVSGGAPTGTAWVATDALNFRSGPSLSDGVIAILQNGDAVELTGQQSNGFWQANAVGSSGWLFADYLTTSVAPTAPDTDNGDTSGPVGVGDITTGTATVTSGLNLRSGPGLDFAVQRVMPAGSSVELRGDPQGSYHPLSYNGTTGWAHGDWLNIGGGAAGPSPDSGNDGPVNVGDGVTGSARVSANLNLRSGPGLDFNVQRVMPSGAAVELRGDPQGSYYPLSYNGTTGWAHGDWLDIGGSGSEPGPAPTPEPTRAPDTGDGSGNVPDFLYTTVALNMRSGSSTDTGVVWVIPPNTRVTITGPSKNGFYPAEWAHVSGWMHSDYLSANHDGPSTDGNEDIIAIIYAAADRYDQPRADMLRVAQCESHLDPKVINPRSGTSGLFQFRPGTWATTPYAKQDIFDPVANANAAAWMWDNGRRNEWACQ